VHELDSAEAGEVGREGVLVGNGGRGGSEDVEWCVGYDSHCD
jgi:hypothetical protein